VLFVWSEVSLNAARSDVGKEILNAGKFSLNMLYVPVLLRLLKFEGSIYILL
jgi:hypothetical protein